jgi:hypothetical protein
MKFFRIAAAEAAEENIIIIKLALYFRKAPRTRVFSERRKKQLK